MGLSAAVDGYLNSREAQPLQQHHLPQHMQVLNRRLEALGAWDAHCQEQENQPRDSREGQIDATRWREIRRRCEAAMTLSAEAVPADNWLEPARMAPRAVVAFWHDWRREQLSAALEAQGLHVVSASRNAAETLGHVIWQQPDLLVVGERLEMLTVEALIALTGQFSTHTVIAAQASEADGLGEILDAGVRGAFSRQLGAQLVAVELSDLVQ